MPGTIRLNSLKGLKASGHVRKSKTRGDMNATESKFAELLEVRRLTGEIAGWWFEPMAFRLADRTTYTPDFMVLLNDGTLELIDTKVYWHGKGGKKGRAGWEEDARVKVKIAAEMYPLFTFKGAVLKDGAWIYEEF